MKNNTIRTPTAQKSPVLNSIVGFLSFNDDPPIKTWGEFAALTAKVLIFGAISYMVLFIFVAVYNG